jgi:CheY-like chemotaxis protein
MTPRILIADQDQQWLERTERFLSNCGYEVVIASDGLECLGKLRELTTDLLVLEREMPWGGGDGVIDLIRQDRDEGTQLAPVNEDSSGEDVVPDIPVILLTAGSSWLDRGIGDGPPVVACLRKPFRMGELLKHVERELLPGSPATEAFLARADSILAHQFAGQG